MIFILNNKYTGLSSSLVPYNFIILKLQAKYIAQCMEEIKVELRQDNIAVKANAVAKLTYVSMQIVNLYL